MSGDADFGGMLVIIPCIPPHLFGELDILM